MLNMQSEAYNTVFYSYLARFMNTVTGLTLTLIRILVAASQEYVNTYSTRSTSSRQRTLPCDRFPV